MLQCLEMELLVHYLLNTYGLLNAMLVLVGIPEHANLSLRESS